MTPKEGGKFTLSGKDLDEAMTLDPGDMSQAILKSIQTKRRELLIRRNCIKAKMLIREAVYYFESCPKICFTVKATGHHFHSTPKNNASEVSR